MEKIKPSGSTYIKWADDSAEKSDYGGAYGYNNTT